MLVSLLKTEVGKFRTKEIDPYERARKKLEDRIQRLDNFKKMVNSRGSDLRGQSKQHMMM